MLDIGTRTGFWVDYFFGRGVEYITGIDIAPTAIECFKEKHSDWQGLEFLLFDIGDSGFPERESFDLAVAMDTLFHIVDDARFGVAIDNIAFSLKLGGYLFLTDSLSPSGDTIAPPQHIRWRSLAMYEHELENNWLDIVYLAPTTELLLNHLMDTRDPLERLLNLVFHCLTIRLTSSLTYTAKDREHLPESSVRP